jgi:hypothetical protein
MPALWTASGISKTPFGHILGRGAQINCSFLDSVNSYGTYRGRDILHVARQSKVNFSNENHDSPTDKLPGPPLKFGVGCPVPGST